MSIFAHQSRGIQIRSELLWRKCYSGGVVPLRLLRRGQSDRGCVVCDHLHLQTTPTGEEWAWCTTELQHVLHRDLYVRIVLMKTCSFPCCVETDDSAFSMQHLLHNLLLSASLSCAILPSDFGTRLVRETRLVLSSRPVFLAVAHQGSASDEIPTLAHRVDAVKMLYGFSLGDRCH